VSTNQLHGKKFEDVLKALAFPGSADAGRPLIALFDVEARFDKAQHLPTSIKATGDHSVALADARRFWAISEPFRLIVGEYRQQDGNKSFQRLHEFLVSVQALDVIRGSISPSDIAHIHEGMGLSHFPRGHHAQARAWARYAVSEANTRCGLITLNPKIDSKSQRRLQCSTHIDKLVEFAAQSGQGVTHDGVTYRCHQDRFGDMTLPFVIPSRPRQFRPR
jgi:hypothetical protein